MMQITNDRVGSLGNNVRLFINVDGQDIFGSHGPHPMLDRAGYAACKVNIRRNARTGLAHLIGVIAPAIVGDRARSTDDAIQQLGKLFERSKAFR